MKIEIKGAIFLQKYDWQDEAQYVFREYDSDSEDRIKVCDHSFTVDVPEKFDPKPALIKVLRGQQDALRAKSEQMITRIEEKIQSLLCIEAK